MTETKTNGKTKIAHEVAEAEFVRMCDARRIEHDASDLTDEEKKEFAELRGDIVRMIMRGTLVVGESGDPAYTPPGGQTLTFHVPTGATLMALETHPGGKNIANLMAAMQEMTHSNPGTFAKMRAVDVKACGRLASLFLADR